MAGGKVSKFIYQIQAEYSGRTDIQRLQADLNALGQIEGYNQQVQEWQRLNQELQQARTRARALRHEMQQNPGNQGVAQRYAEAAREARNLERALSGQRQRLDRAEQGLRAAGIAASQAAERYRELQRAVEQQGRGAAARNLLGVRSDSTIRSEIQGLQRAYRDLATSGTASTEELRRAAENLRTRIRALRQEMQGTSRADSARNLLGVRSDSTIRSEIQGLQRAYRDLATSGTASTEELRRAAENLRTRIRALRQEMQGTSRADSARGLLGIRSDADIRRQVDGLRNAYRDLARSGTASFAELQRAQQAMRTRIRELTSDTNGWTNATGRLQAGFAKVVIGIGALRLGRTGLDSLTQYDDAMRRVSAIAGATAKEFEALDDTAQHLAASTRFSAKEIAMAMQQLAAAGQTVGQIQNSIQAVMDVAAIAQMDVGEAADQLTNIMTQFGIEAQHSATVADALVAGFTGSATTMAELANAMTYAGPVAHALGMELEDTTAVLMGLANAGYKGERAGTSLRGGLTRLIRPMRMGRQVLEKYNIQIFDSENRMRAFADILEDVAKAGMSPAEMIKLFGQEAGPGMIALLGQGADAIRKYRTQIDAAGGDARRLANEMEQGIGGARRRLEAATDALLRSSVAAIEPYLRPLIESLAELAASIANLSPETKQWALALVTLVGAMTALGGAIKMLAMARFVLTLGGLSSALSAAAGGAATFGASVAAAGLALKASFVGVVIASALAVEKLISTIHEWRDAEREVQASRERGKVLEQQKVDMYRRISDATGVVVKTQEQLNRAEAEGKIHFDETTKSWKKGAGERQQAAKDTAKATQDAVKVEGEALKELVEEYKKAVDEIKRLQDEIMGRQKSLSAELRDMSRSGMTDKAAWQDQKREAEEYVIAAKKAAEEAKTAFASGDTISATAKWKEAVQLADDAKNAYKALNKEVKEGDNVAISKADALKTAMDGVKEAGELGIEILKQQQDEAKKTLESLEKESGEAGLINHMDEAQQKWLKSWGVMADTAKDAVRDVGATIDDEIDPDEIEDAGGETIRRLRDEGEEAAEEIGRAIDEACKPRTVKIYTQTVQGRRWGGLVLRYADAVEHHLARGGKLPGYGGGDRVPAMLEPGEFVIRKEAVARFGEGFFERLNSLRLPDMPVPAAAVPVRTVNINLTLPSGDTYQLSADPATADRIEREQARWWSLRSSNRVRRPGIGRTP